LEHFWNTSGFHSRSRSFETGGHSRPSLSSVRSTLPFPGITKFRLRHLEAITIIREERDKGNQQLAYNARPFVLCGIPLRRPPKDRLIHTRHNGKFFPEIAGHPTYGLPFGQDRLIPIWVATLAVQQKSRMVRFRSAAQMLDFFHLSKDGRHYRRIVHAFQRVFAATIFFGTDDQPDRQHLADSARFHFFDKLHLGFHDHGQPLPASEGAENTITLSEAFYNEIDAHRIPAEREVVAALAHAPGILDFYIWLVWRSWIVNGSSAHVPLFTDPGLCSQLGTTEYPARRFRQLIGQWLRRVKALWPQCPVNIAPDGNRLIVRSSRVCPAITSVEKC
jgi:hypothetical protein